MIYFDHNATTPLRPEVRDAMGPYLDEEFGNPSSLHGPGRRAREAVEGRRQQIALCLGCDPGEVHFTSGGTEADNWALRGMAGRRPGAVVVSAVEHHAVVHTAEAMARGGHDVITVAVDTDGRLDPDRVLAAATDAAVVSVILANNETGTLQPVAEIGAGLRRRGIPLHVDAVQAFGKVPVRVDDLKADLVSLSAHKINGPKGVGALYVRRDTAIDPWQTGGGHEQGLRAGTENVAAIVGFGAAAALRQAELAVDSACLRRLRDRLQDGLHEAIGDMVVNGSVEHRLSNTLNASFRGVEAEAVLLGLDLEGICASSGSACAEGATEPSHVLLAMGLEPRLAASAVRFSLGWGNDESQVDRVVTVLPGIVARLRELSVF
jgi:cysteine desulfurase